MTDFTKQNSTFILGVSGGSGSGKTYFAQALLEFLGAESCEIISQDNYYIDQSHRFDFDGGAVNFDHPDSIDFELLASQVSDLKRGVDVNIPIYDFKSHSRLAETRRVRPKRLVIIDGILIFHPSNLRGFFDDLIFFETPEDVRFSRRLERDVKERGRTVEGVRNQFYKQVKPMHDQFVEPSKIHARSVVKTDEDFKQMLTRVKKRLGIG